MMHRNRKYKILFLLVCGLVSISACAKVDVHKVKEDLLTQAEREIELTGTQEDTEEEKVSCISEGKLAHDVLTEEQKQIYDEVLYAILNQKESVMLSHIDERDLDIAYHAVNADYGGLFWVSGYAYTQYKMGDIIMGLEFTPQYTMSLEERETMQAQIDQKAEEMLRGISIADSDYAKAKYVYELLAKEVEYDTEAENNQNILSVFLEGRTVCQGYACATQYLLNQLGVPCVIVTGSTDETPHAWNMAVLDGAPYYMDTTWGNAKYLNGNAEFDGIINYDYLNIMTAELTKTHRIETDFPLPECDSNLDNYYVKEGLYYTDWYPDEIGALYRNAWESGTSVVSLKFADTALYVEAKDYFINNQGLGEYCDGLKSYYYLENPEQNILTIHFGER
ncbi:MAG: transglutaminase domain-containing protein [Lachnospiraceae bacterium]|nr:transglutaminase domain-containing protein [Lachnospiraceae bacterium]